MLEARQQRVFPYVYGSLALSMGKKSDCSYTHKWICYVRGVHNEDLSYLLDKVVFILHNSFQNPVREILKPPYEIQEVGWGEFEIIIKLYFKHPNMPHIEISHMLKLHHTSATGSQATKKPLCSEVYDEIVFTSTDEYIDRFVESRNAIQQEEMVTEVDPNEEYEMAVADQQLQSITKYSRYMTTMDANDHKTKIEDAMKFIRGEISILEEKMKIADMDIQKVYEDIYNRLP